ncbi:hypothetical protein PLICRDRAFT_532294 [Plicaturopsis crispa FD-325 SS-3]|nr:hypothetical protein PLICRDRAFT_532294 [Plicaturopsis crispa FD-325 SS-3]
MSARVQQPAPGFTAEAVVDGQFKNISLSDYLGKWVILLFYPLDFTFVCPTEILAFAAAQPQFAGLSIPTHVLAISTDSAHSHLAWASQPRKVGGLGFYGPGSTGGAIPMVADKNHAISKAYGVLIEDEGIALRGLFLIDPKGVLRQATINDLPVAREVPETLRLVQAFQFTDVHGEVCPVGWQAGDKGMDTSREAVGEWLERDAGKGETGSKRPRVQ